MMDISSLLGLGGFLLACFAASGSGAFFRPGPWYRRLRKPSFNPPDWLFAPAWTVLYLAIAIAAWLVWEVRGFGPEIALWFFSLLLNAAWSWLFFGKRRMDLAFYELVVFWLSIAGMLLAFAPASATAAWLIAPYLAWVSFAGLLNWALWRLNPDQVGAPDEVTPQPRAAE